MGHRVSYQNCPQETIPQASQPSPSPLPCQWIVMLVQSHLNANFFPFQLEMDKTSKNSEQD